VYFDVVEPLKGFLPDLEWYFEPYLVEIFVVEWYFEPYLVEIFVDIHYLYDLGCYFEPLKVILPYFVPY
jgi:hypothetical protein